MHEKSNIYDVQVIVFRDGPTVSTCAKYLKPWPNEA